MRRLILIGCLLGQLSYGSGQHFFRIAGDYSVKSKMADGTAQLVMGKFYYDRNYRKVVYVNSFPEKETWVTADSVLCHIIDGKVQSFQSAPPASEFTIFHLTLSSRLNQFGLEGSSYRMTDVEKQGDMVITTWEPPPALSKLFGKVIISNVNRRLHGIVFYDHLGNLVKKQFFSNYDTNKGLDFPGEVTEIIYDSGREHYRVTTYRNISVNENGNDHIYDYPVRRD